MSHDRKPGRVLVMDAAAEAPQRRRGDGPGVIVEGASVAMAEVPGHGSGHGSAQAPGRRAGIVWIILFVLAAAAGAAATQLYFAS